MIAYKLPEHIGGYQHIELATALVEFGDILVLAGKPMEWASTNWLGLSVIQAEASTGMNVYRKLCVPRHVEDKPQDGEKPTNPKDIIGSDKLPLHLWPTTATALGSIALLEGALKYGRTNWRPIGVKASVYYAALNRHMNAWWEGEEVAPDSQIDHLGHAIACLAILIDAKATGNLNDDRMYPGKYNEFVEALAPHVKRLKEKYKDKQPRHYSIGDKQ